MSARSIPSAGLGAALGAALLLSSCGYVGDPLPPALHIPQPVADLRVRQTGPNLVFDFTIPELTTESLGLRLGEVDLRVSAADPGADLNAWVAHSEPVAVRADKPGPVHLEASAAPWTGKPIWIAVRVASDRGRWSAWSAVETMEVVPPPPTPENLRAEAAAEGVRLRWDHRGGPVRIWRKSPADAELAAVATAEREPWTDTATQFGLTYEYAVQSAAGKTESLRSSAVRITPEDTFPPAPPAGLTALAGIGSIELSWEPVAAADLAGYRVYRATGTDAGRAVGSMSAAPSFRDREIVSGTRYRYSVTSVDRRGNESRPSESVEAEAP